MASYTQHLQQVTPSPSPSPTPQNPPTPHPQAQHPHDTQTNPRTPTQPRTRLQARRGVITQSAPPTTPKSHSSVLLLLPQVNPGAVTKGVDASTKGGNATSGPSRRTPMVRTRSRSRSRGGQLEDSRKLTSRNLARHDDNSIQTIPIASSSLLDPETYNAIQKERESRERSHLPTYASIATERKRNYPTNHTIRVIKRAATKLLHESTQHHSSFDSLEKLLKEARVTVDEGTRKAREVVWLRFCLEHDFLGKVKRERRYWDGTFVGGEGVRMWGEFLEDVGREKEEMGRRELERLDRELEEIEKMGEGEGSGSEKGSDTSVEGEEGSGSGSDDGRGGGGGSGDGSTKSESRKRARDVGDYAYDQQEEQQDEEEHKQMKRARRDIDIVTASR